MRKAPPAYRDFDFQSFIISPPVMKFLGQYYAYYKALWEKDIEKKGGNSFKAATCLHWNWLAVLFIPAWLGYHKMPGYVVGLAMAIGGVFFAEAYFDYEVGPGAFAGGLIVVGLMAKSFYLHHVISFFYRHRDKSSEELDSLITKRGGTSPALAIAYSIVYIGILFASLYIADLLFGHPANPANDADLLIQGE